MARAVPIQDISVSPGNLFAEVIQGLVCARVRRSFGWRSHNSVGQRKVLRVRQLEVNGRKYWILSEPRGSGWKALVVELIDRDGEFTEPVGIEASAQTRGAADSAAERKLRRLLRLPSA